MIAESIAYLASRNITRKEPLYSANKMARLIGDIAAEDITTGTLVQFREAMLAAGLKPRTIESAISDIMTVVKWKTGREVPPGSRLRLTKPQPSPAERDIVDAIWPHAEPWIRAWMAFAYWTGLRLSDTLCVLKEHRGKPLPQVLRWTASKTGKHHVYPVPGWLRKIVGDTPYPLRTVKDFARRQVRAGLHSACVKAGVDVVCPKQFRQRSITEWSMANASAGALIHGRDLGILNHYVDPLSVLESAASRVRLPACFGATKDDGEELLLSYKRLDPDGKAIVSSVASRLAGAG